MRARPLTQPSIGVFFFALLVAARANAQTYPPMPDEAHEGTPSYHWQGPAMIQQHPNRLFERGLPTCETPFAAETQILPWPASVRHGVPNWIDALLKNPDRVSFVPAPGMPEGVRIAGLGHMRELPLVVLYMRVPGGMTIPPHWMSARRELLTMSGHVQILDDKGLPVAREDGLDVVPSRGVTTIACAGRVDCVLAVRQLGDFDPHYVARMPICDGHSCAMPAPRDSAAQR